MIVWILEWPQHVSRLQQWCADRGLACDVGEVQEVVINHPWATPDPIRAIRKARRVELLSDPADELRHGEDLIGLIDGRDGSPIGVTWAFNMAEVTSRE